MIKKQTKPNFHLISRFIILNWAYCNPHVWDQIDENWLKLWMTSPWPCHTYKLAKDSLHIRGMCLFKNFPWKSVSKQYSRHFSQKVQPLLSWCATCWPHHLTQSHWSTEEQQDHPHCRQLLVGGVAHVTVAVAGWHAAPLVWNVTSDTGVGGGRALTQPPRPATGLPALQHHSSHPPHLTNMSTKTTQGKGRLSASPMSLSCIISLRISFPYSSSLQISISLHCLMIYWWLTKMYLSLQIFKFTSFPNLEIKNNFPFYFFASKH